MQATFQQLRNDMYWKAYGLRWIGYDDSYWWETIAPSEAFQIQKNSEGKAFRLNPETNEVLEVVA